VGAERQIAGERVRLLIEHGEVVVAALSATPAGDVPVPGSSSRVPSTKKRRRMMRTYRSFIAHDRRNACEVELSARGQGSRQIPVTDESCSVAQECRISKTHDPGDRECMTYGWFFRAGANGAAAAVPRGTWPPLSIHRDRAVAH